MTTNAPRVWCRWGLYASDSGSVRVIGAPGFQAAIAGHTAFVTVLGHSMTIFDTRAEYLPFHPDRPDAPGFRLGPYYLAFNRGRDS